MAKEIEMNKQLTWQELKDFVNKLTHEQLNDVVRFWGEEIGGIIDSVEQLPEDFVETDYGMEPASVQEYEEGDEHCEVILPKGTPIFNI